MIPLGILASAKRPPSSVLDRAAPVPGAEVNPNGLSNAGFSFKVSTPAQCLAVWLYRPSVAADAIPVRLWSNAGVELAAGTLPASSAAGWWRVPITPVSLAVGGTYTASFHRNNGTAIQLQGSYFNPTRASSDGVITDVRGRVLTGSNPLTYPPNGHSNWYGLDVEVQAP